MTDEQNDIDPLEYLRSKSHRWCEDQFYACPLAPSDMGGIVGDWNGGEPVCDCDYDTIQLAADEIERLRKYEAGIKDLASKACLEECDRHDRLRLSGICAPCWARRIELSDD